MSKKEEPKLNIIEDLNKKFGKGTIIGGGDTVDQFEVVSTGSLTLDIATGIGGNPVGKLIEIFGPESSGKSTLTLHCIAENQKKGIKAVYMDYEQSFDKNYAKKLGVDIDTLYIAQPTTMEDGYTMARMLIESKEVGLIVIDSQTAMIPAKALESEIGDAKMALQARINSEALQRLKPLLLPNNCTMIVISQLRTNIGGYGDPNIPSGGNAYKFYSDMRYKVSKVLDKTNELNKTSVEVIKNKCARPFGKAEFNIIWGEGIDRIGELIDLAVEYKFMDKAGAWYTFNELKFQDSKLRDYFNNNPEIKEDLEIKILNKIKEDA